MDLPPIDYTSTEDRAILRWKYMGEEILIQYYWQTWHPCAYLKVKKIPEDINYEDVKGLRIEAKQKLIKVRPLSVGQASRISGVSPADVSVLLIYLETRKRRS